MAKPLVIVLDRYCTKAIQMFQLENSVDIIQKEQSQLTSEEKQNCTGILIRTKVKVDEKLLSQFPNLKYIVTATTGFDHIDFSLTSKRNILAYHVPEANQHSATELTWTLILACTKKLLEANKLLKEANWNRNLVMGSELKDKTLGILGLGRIGSRVAKIAQAFEMHVVAYDPYKSDEHFKNLNVDRLSLVEALRASDILSLHLPHTPETHHMLNHGSLSYLQEGAILINTSRGAVINENALYDYLLNKKISMAGLDVFEKEPMAADSLLLKLPNTVLTPHIGANTLEAFERSCEFASQKMLQCLKGEIPEEGNPLKEAWFNAKR